MHNQIVSANLQGPVALVGNFYSLQKWKLAKWQPSKPQNSLGQGLINYSKGGFVVGNDLTQKSCSKIETEWCCQWTVQKF